MSTTRKTASTRKAASDQAGAPAAVTGTGDDETAPAATGTSDGDTASAADESSSMANTGTASPDEGDDTSDPAGTHNESDEQLLPVVQPCEEHFPLGWTEGATSLGCEHGQWDL